MLASVVVLHEDLTPHKIVGLSLVIVGLTIYARLELHTEPPPPQQLSVRYTPPASPSATHARS